MLGVALSLCSCRPSLPSRTFPHSRVSSSFIDLVCIPHRSELSLLWTRISPIFPTLLIVFHEYISTTLWTSSTFLYTLRALIKLSSKHQQIFECLPLNVYLIATQWSRNINTHILQLKTLRDNEVEWLSQDHVKVAKPEHESKFKLLITIQSTAS